MSLEENLTKCPKCSIDFTGRGWNKGNIKKHMNKHFIKTNTFGNKQITDLWSKAKQSGVFLYQ
jgi:hypothetical protein